MTNNKGDDPELATLWASAETEMLRLELLHDLLDRQDAVLTIAIADLRSATRKRGIRLSARAEGRPPKLVKPMAPEAILAELAALLAEAAKEVTRSAVAPSDAAEWVDQNSSPLGSRRHRELVRAGRLPGRRVGKLVLVKKLDMEMYLASQPDGATVMGDKGEHDVDEIDRLLEEAGAKRQP